MLEMFFFLRFQSQLRRTRAALLKNLENSITETMKSFGGSVYLENRLIRASFDPDTAGFALDMLCMLENLHKTLENVSTDLYGYTCVFGEDVNEDNMRVFIRDLPAKFWNTGIWCGSGLQKILEPFVEFEDALSLPHTAPLSGYALIKKGIRIFDAAVLQNGASSKGIAGGFLQKAKEAALADHSERIFNYLKQGLRCNTAIVGDSFIGKRKGVYRYCASFMGDFPPLAVRFGGANPVICVADSFSPEIQKILAPEDLQKLENEAEVLFCDRLRDEVSEFFVRNCGRFFRTLLESYAAAAGRANIPPVLVLENLQLSDSFAQRIITEACFSLNQHEREAGGEGGRSLQGDLCVFGTSNDMPSLKIWETLLPRVVKFSTEKRSARLLPEMPVDIWEILYSCALFNRYFPAFLFPRLFAEEGKNPVMIERTLTLLSELELISSVSNPTVRIPETVSRAEEILGERTERIRRAVRNRLLAWVEKRRLKPCFRLLEALSDLGGVCGEGLMLEAVYNDVINGVYTGMERAAAGLRFEEVVGRECAAPLRFIFTAFKALNHGDRQEIQNAFAEEPSTDALYPGFYARITALKSAYSLSVCDSSAAAVLAKKAMLIVQEKNAENCLADIYRLFSLVNITKRQLSEAIDYFAFAQTEAGKTSNAGEQALTCFYAAAAHFVFGNISKAERLASEAEEAALISGRPEWADKARFFRGRLCFETGRYRDALDIFTALEKERYGKSGAAFETTLAAWMYRANIYQGATPPAPSPGLDAAIFELESAFLAGDYRKTLELAQAPDDVSQRDRFLYIEQPDWRSGFAQCEMLFFPMMDLRERMFLTYRALALCHIDDLEQCDKDAAIREMRRVIRDELPDEDPHDAFYFYAYYQVLKRTGAPEVDLNTAISLAFKRLQRRASRIDNNETRRMFLSSHLWNNALEISAREHKLI